MLSQGQFEGDNMKITTNDQFGFTRNKVLVGCSLLIMLGAGIFGTLLLEILPLFRHSENADEFKVKIKREWHYKQTFQDFVEIEPSVPTLMIDIPGKNQPKVMSSSDNLKRYLDGKKMLWNGVEYPIPESWFQATLKKNKKLTDYFQELLKKQIVIEEIKFEKDYTPDPSSVNYVELSDNYRLALSLARFQKEHGNTEFLLTMDAATPVLILSTFVSSDGVLSLLSGIIAHSILATLDKEIRDFYLTTTNLTTTEIDNMTTALKKRLTLLPLLKDFTSLFESEMYYMNSLYENKLKKQAWWSLTLMEMWYGHPGTVFKKIIFEAKKARMSGEEAVHQLVNNILLEYKNNKKSQNWLGQITNLLTHHPLVSMAMPNYTSLIQEIGEHIAQYRLTTLIGLLRLHNFQTGKWPRKDSELDFFKNAGLALIDPVTNQPFSLTYLEDNKMEITGTNFSEEAKKSGKNQYSVKLEPLLRAIEQSK
jgi:hypothetical protein